MQKEVRNAVASYIEKILQKELSRLQRCFENGNDIWETPKPAFCADKPKSPAMEAQECLQELKEIPFCENTEQLVLESEAAIAIRKLLAEKKAIADSSVVPPYTFVRQHRL